MTLLNRIDSLAAKRKDLNGQIYHEMSHLSVDFMRVTTLKKRRLLIEQELDTLRRLAKAT